jgi:glycyl-tRNA synthetase beta chain
VKAKRKSPGLRAAAPRDRVTAAELLFEIGTEELPAQFMPPALRALAETAERLLKESRLTHGAIRSLGTPRRLALAVERVAGRQAAAVKDVMGPPKSVAFDAAGAPTKAALGFAAAQGVAVRDLEIRPGAKGEYLFAVKKEPGRPAAEVLSELLPKLATDLSFPKSMRWNTSGLRFARPIRWLLAVYGGHPIRVQVGGLRAGNRTYGHRVLSGPSGMNGLVVRDLKTYRAQLERHGVVPDQDRRRRMIVEQLDRLSKAAGGILHRDEELLEQAVYTVEYPQAIAGGFNPQYLSLPKEVLITAMKEHQGYFSLVRPDGALLPQFLTVTNMKSGTGLIRQGNERVLAARLADAKFFFDEDRKVPLPARVEQLRGVTFHAKLGTLDQKRERLVRLAGRLATWLSLPPDLAEAAKRAAELCKADLLTGMVGEFPTLQGVMGREYARHAGEPEAVCLAIGEHYLPRAADDELPATPAGQVVSLADRLDTILAFFQAGILPTGSEDPFALRRQALGVVRIVLEKKLALDLRQALKVRLLEDRLEGAPMPAEGSDPLQFILDRLRYYVRTVHGLRDDVIDAVLNSLKPVDEINLLDLFSRMQALQTIATRPEFDPLMIGFKRAHRIVEKEDGKDWARPGAVDPGLLRDASESALHRTLEQASLVIPGAMKRRDYETVLQELIRMKPPIDAFFQAVMVNTEDQALRRNRLSLLDAIDRLFLLFADFSQIQVQEG